MEQGSAEIGGTALISQKEEIHLPVGGAVWTCEEHRSGKVSLSNHNLSLIILGLASSS